MRILNFWTHSYTHSTTYRPQCVLHSNDWVRLNVPPNTLWVISGTGFYNIASSWKSKVEMMYIIFGFQFKVHAHTTRPTRSLSASHNPTTGLCSSSTTMVSPEPFPDKVTAVPVRRNGNVQNPISVPAVRPKRCHTLSNPAHRQDYTVACLNYTLQTMMPWLTSYGS